MAKPRVRQIRKEILFSSSELDLFITNLFKLNFFYLNEAYSRDEYMAVRNAEGSFYICKAMQNIFLGSKNIKIQWLSNEDPVVPAKDNPDGDIFAHDFYDKTGIKKS